MLLGVLKGWSKFPCKRGGKNLEVREMELGYRGAFLAPGLLFTFCWKIFPWPLSHSPNREIASGEVFKWNYRN